MSTDCRTVIGRLGEHGPAAAFETVVLENAHLRAVVLPGKGADIYSVVHRATGIDVLGKTPWGPRPPSQIVGMATTSEQAWMDHYEGGWQEVFPSGGGPASVDGVEHSYHGESTVVPWDYDVIQAGGESCAVRFTVRLARSPLFLERTMSLTRDAAVLTLTERLVNEGPSPFDVMWGHHPAYGAPLVDGDCIVDVPADTFIAAEQLWGPTQIASSTRGPWPHVPARDGGTVDLRRTPPRTQGWSNFGCLTDLREGWYALTNPRLGLGVGMTFPTDVFPHIWFWQELAGDPRPPWFSRCYLFALEPFTTWPSDGLAVAREHGTSRWLQPGEALAATVRLVLFESLAGVERITPDGRVVVRTS